jgi:hypothetical protein
VPRVTPESPFVTDRALSGLRRDAARLPGIIGLPKKGEVVKTIVKGAEKPWVAEFEVRARRSVLIAKVTMRLGEEKSTLREFSVNALTAENVRPSAALVVSLLLDGFISYTAGRIKNRNRDVRLIEAYVDDVEEGLKTLIGAASGTVIISHASAEGPIEVQSPDTPVPAPAPKAQAPALEEANETAALPQGSGSSKSSRRSLPWGRRGDK